MSIWWNLRINIKLATHAGLRKVAFCGTKESKCERGQLLESINSSKLSCTPSMMYGYCHHYDVMLALRILLHRTEST